MIWVKWNSLDSFNTWHDEIKTILGLPKPSINEDGEIVEDAVITDSYVSPLIVAEDDIRALIDEVYADGLETSASPIVSHYEAAPK